VEAPFFVEAPLLAWVFAFDLAVVAPGKLGATKQRQQQNCGMTRPSPVENPACAGVMTDKGKNSRLRGNRIPERKRSVEVDGRQRQSPRLA
jgi:hypothetical protein